MKITGHIHEVTDLIHFAPSYLSNPKKPMAGTFKSASGLHVHIGSILEGVSPAFIPGVSAETISAADGKFSLNVSDSLLKQLQVNKMAYFTAYRKIGSVNVMGHVTPAFEAVYRSSAFDITKYKGDEVEIYFAPFNVPKESGITQKQVDEQVKQAKAQFKDLEKLSANILDGSIAVSGSGRGADLKFKIDLYTSTSFDLSEFIRGYVKDMDIDLPGPDLIVGIFVSKDDIQKGIEKGIANMMEDVNGAIEKELITQIAKGTGQSPDVVGNIFKTTASITFTKLNYPVVAHNEFKLGEHKWTFDVRSIVPKLAVGFPRNIG